MMRNTLLVMLACALAAPIALGLPDEVAVALPVVGAGAVDDAALAVPAHTADVDVDAPAALPLVVWAPEVHVPSTAIEVAAFCPAAGQVLSGAGGWVADTRQRSATFLARTDDGQAVRVDAKWQEEYVLWDSLEVPVPMTARSGAGKSMQEACDARVMQQVMALGYARWNQGSVPATGWQGTLYDVAAVLADEEEVTTLPWHDDSHITYCPQDLAIRIGAALAGIPPATTAAESAPKHAEEPTGMEPMAGSYAAAGHGLLVVLIVVLAGMALAFIAGRRELDEE
jgi:hypothetical protein